MKIYIIWFIFVITWNFGFSNAILIEDVITSGKSVIDAAEKLEGNGLIISQIITAFSRSENKELMYKDIPIEFLYNMDDI